MPCDRRRLPRTLHFGNAYQHRTLTTLYTFRAQGQCPSGAEPVAGLVQGADGNLYGTTQNRGEGWANGTVFEITPSGTLTTL
jgi:hypothetical protein